jgi:hypothetical protein
MEKKGKNIEELNNEGWITNLAFLVDVTGHLKNLNRELQGKYKLITNMYDNIKAFKVKLRLWGSELKLYNLVQISRLKSLDTIFLSVFKNIPSPFSFLREEFNERFQDFKIIEP